MQLIEAIIQNPVKVAVGVLLVALFGVIALAQMPMQLTPEVQIPTITVETRWPGASPQEVEKEIVQQQEEHLKSVEGLVKMSSECKDSVGEIALEFRIGTNMNEALLKVNSRLQRVAEYPEKDIVPVISTSDISARSIAWFILSARMASREEIEHFQRDHPKLADELTTVLAANNEGLAVLRLRRLAQQHPQLEPLLPPDIDVPTLRKFAEDHIEAQFERVDGVSNSNVLGGRDPELQVVVDPHKLAARGLTIEDVRRVLEGENRDTSGGDIWEGKRRWVVRTLGRFRSIEQVERQVLAVNGGAPVYIRDVVVDEDFRGRKGVRLGYKKPDGFVRRFGVSNIAINAGRETGANVLEVMRGLREKNRLLNETVLKDRRLVLTQVYDETDYIYSAVGLVNQNILVGGSLTFLVLLLFLQSGRSTVVIALAIPTSLIGTFLILSLLGRSLNVVSLAGLAFAVGMLVDNAVVVLENIYRHYQSGDSPFVAAARGTKEVWGAVVASTLTTLAVFLPVIFIKEEAGQLFLDIALAISAAVALSLLVSVTVIPTAAARILQRRGDRDIHGAAEPPEHRNLLARLLLPLTLLGRAFVRMVIGANRWIQRSTMRRVTVVGVLVLSAVLVILLQRPQVEYLPNGNRNLVFGRILPPPGYNLDELMQIGQTVEDHLQPYWDVDPETDEIDHLKYPTIGDFFYVARGREVFLGLRAHDPQRAGELVELVTSLQDKLPGTIVVASQSSLFGRGLTAGRTIEIEITGPELSQLVAFGGQILGQVTPVLEPDASNENPAKTQARPIPSLDLSSPEVHITPRILQAKQMGLSATDLGYMIDALIDGAYAADYFIGGEKIDLVIIGSDRVASRTQDVQELPVAIEDGLIVPIEALASVQMSSGPEQVNHRERQRAITIAVTPPDDMPLEEAIARINSQILDPIRQSGELGGQYTIHLSGTADKLLQTWRALRWNVLLALLITYLLMAALFESWVYPLVIIFSVPLGAAGGVLGLQMLGYYQAFTTSVLGWARQPPPALDVLTMLGFVILIGTVVNNAILIVHQSLNYMRLEGMQSRDAILESVRTRIRPIFMTTATTVFGLAPLVFFPGAGSELYRGLGSVVLSGLLVSTIFTLVMVPTLFSLMMDLVERLRSALGLEVAAPVEVARPELADDLQGVSPTRPK